MTRGKKAEQEPDDAPCFTTDQDGSAATSNLDKMEELTSLVKSQASRDQLMERVGTPGPEMEKHAAPVSADASTGERFER